jgi:hypothetical protein
LSHSGSPGVAGPQSEFAAAWAALIRTEHDQAAYWLAVAQESSDACGTTAGRAELQHAAEVLRALGHAAVAGWIEGFLDEAD